MFLLPSCVYFNTYYNAQKYFRQAEKTRLKQESESLDLGISLSGRQTGRRLESASRSQPRRARSGAHALYEKAAKKASDVLEKHRDSDLVDDAMFLAGRALYWNRDYAYAARSFSDLETNFPDSEYAEKAKYWRGLCLEDQELNAEAREVYRSLVNSAGRTTGSKAGFRLGEMAYVQEDYTAALEEFHSTLTAFPETELRGEIWLRIGESNMALGQPTRLDSAEAAFERAHDLAASDKIEYKARLNRGRVSYAKGEFDAAQQVYLDLLSESRFRRYEGETRLLLAEYFERSGSLDDALAEYERIRDDFPQTAMSAMAIYRTGILYLQEYGQRERSQEYLEEVQKEKKGSEAALLSREFLADFKKLDGLVRQIYLADSLDVADAQVAAEEAFQAAVADSIALVVAADSLAAVDAGTAPDSSSTPTIAAQLDSSEVAFSELGTTSSELDTTSSVDTTSSSAAHETGAIDIADSVAVGQPTIVAAVVEEQAERLTAAAKRPSAAKPPKGKGRKRKKDPRVHRLDNLFGVAELFRDRLAISDSAAHYYSEIERRFPDSDQLPRVLYSIGWIRVEMDEDLDLARPFFERLIGEYSESAHANAARSYLKLPSESTGEERAAVAFAEIEALKETAPDSVEVYVPLLDSLAQVYPNTEAGVKSAFLAAWSIENVAGDTSAAEVRYAAILDDFPNASLTEIVRDRAEARRSGLADKMQRSLMAIGAGTRPGERIEVIAVEPDSVDSMALSRKYLGFALRAHRRNQFQIAGEMYELSLEERSLNPTALYGRGEVSWQEGYFEDAVETFTAALELDRKLVGVHFRLFEYYVEAGREDSANKYLREFIRRDPKNPELMDLRTEFPLFAGPEPEDLELDILEEFEFSPPETALEPPADLAPLLEEPMVRSSVAPLLPPEVTTDSATVYVDILIDEDGIPEEVEVFEGDEALAAAAEAAASGYVFYPAIARNGFEVRVWVELELPFSRTTADSASVVAEVQESEIAVVASKENDADGVAPPRERGDEIGEGDRVPEEAGEDTPEELTPIAGGAEAQ